MKKFCIVSAVLGAALLSNEVMAISDDIRSNRDDECAIYLCMPGKFGEGCAAAHSAYIGRITDVNRHGSRKYTDLPAFYHCIDQNNENVVDTPEAQASNLTYENLYEITIPDTNQCTRWRVRHYKDNSIRYCAAVNTVKGRVFDSSSNNHSYQDIHIGDSEYSTHRAQARAFTVVKADGTAVGERYYR